MKNEILLTCPTDGQGLPSNVISAQAAGAESMQIIENPKTSLSTAAIAGICIGAVLLIIALMVAGFVYYTKKAKER